MRFAFVGAGAVGGFYGALLARQGHDVNFVARGAHLDAIRAGGSSLRDFFGADGNPGYFQQEYFVYGRTGEPCKVCAAPIATIRQGQRSTFYCPRCQSR